MKQMMVKYICKEIPVSFNNIYNDKQRYIAKVFVYRAWCWTAAGNIKGVEVEQCGLLLCAGFYCCARSKSCCANISHCCIATAG